MSCLKNMKDTGNYNHIYKFYNNFFCRTKMRLKISNIQEEDFGSYKCIAKNNLGEKEGLFRVYSKYDS